MFRKSTYDLNNHPASLSCSLLVCLPFVQHACIIDANICCLAWHPLVGRQEFQKFTPNRKLQDQKCKLCGSLREEWPTASMLL